MKYFFFDYDGTMIQNKAPRVMTERVKKSIPLLKEAGYRTILLTGRCYGAIPSELWDLKFDCYSTSCGAAIYMDGKLVYEDRVDQDFVHRVMKLLWDKRLEGAIEGTERVVFYDRHKDSTTKNFVFSYDEYMEKFGDVPIHKFTLYKVPMDPEVYSFFIDNGFEVINNSNTYYEIIKKGNHKGKGLKDTLRLFNDPDGESYAFGDSMNDEGMFAAATHSFVVASAPDEVKALADTVIGSPADDGVARWIEDFVADRK